MRKLRFVAVILTVLIAATLVPLSAGKTAEAAEWGFLSPDECYIEGIDLLVDEGQESEQLEKNPLYNHYLEVTGFEYIFLIGEAKGYMLVPAIEVSDGKARFQATEVFPNTESPFAGIDGDRVYMSAATYIRHKDGVFFDIATEEQLSETELDFLFKEGFGFRGTLMTFDFMSETVSYAGKSVTSKQVTQPTRVPAYLITDVESSCAPIMGANMLAYFQMTGFDLISEGQIYEFYLVNGAYELGASAEGAVTKSLIKNLANEMKTSASNGTTVANFKNAMTARANAKKFKMVYEPLMSGLFGNTFDIDKFKNYMDTYQKPAAFFLTKFEAGTWPFVLETNGKDTLRSNRYTANHAIMVSGYKTVRYFRYEDVSVWDPIWYNPFRHTTVTQYVNFKTVDYAYASLTIPGFRDVGFIMLGANTKVADAIGVRVTM